jgi:gluconokinase
LLSDAEGGEKVKAVIGLDMGTTLVKAVVFSTDGSVLGRHEIPLRLVQPAPELAEQDPDEVLAAAVAAVRGAVEKACVKPGELAGVGFSAAMHSILPLDEENRPLSRAFTWADNRSAREAEELRRSGEGQEIYRRTGTPVHPMSPLTKLLWMKNANPELWNRAKRFVSLKEYVFFHLTGTFAADHSMASATGLFNLHRKDWDEEILRRLGVKREQLAKPVSVTSVYPLLPAWAEKMGLRPGLPLVTGASDGALANVGTGAVDPGIYAVTIGTSGAVRTVVDKPLTDPQGRTFCYVLDDSHYITGGPMNNGGILLDWFRKEWQKSKQEQLEEMLAEVADVPPGSEGLLCLPYWAGERAPLWNADARGVWFGLGLHHHRKHLLRSLLEGISFSVFSIYRVLREQSGPAKEIRASGGFVRSPEWRQILADVTGCPLAVPESPEASAMGAAMMALTALGEWGDWKEGKSWIRLPDRHEPDEGHHQTYRALYTIFDRLTHQLNQEFHAIAAFQRNQSDRMEENGS